MENKAITAITAIEIIKLTQNGGTLLPDFTPITDAAVGAEMDFTQKDCKTLLLVKNTHATAAKTVTLCKGDGLQGVCDLVFEVAAGQIAALTPESGYFKFTAGEHRGKLLIKPESTDIQALCVILP